VSTATRLARLEGTLSPKEATLAWLAEAHQFPTLAAYVGWLVTQPPEAAPFWRVPEQAERAARASLRGQPRDVVEAAAHQAVRDAVFLLELVIRLNVAAAETIGVEGPRYAALWWEARAITAETELLPASQSPSDRRAITRRWADWRGAVSDWVMTLEEAEAARRLLERQYLDGRDVLFHDLASAWGSLIERAERPAQFGKNPGPAGRPRQRRLRRGAEAPNPGGADARALAADLAGRVRSVALGLLGNAETTAASTAQLRAPKRSDT
jgi:hypothetical protein